MKCPRCIKGSLVLNWDKELSCYSCGYEHIESVPTTVGTVVMTPSGKVKKYRSQWR